MTVITKRKRLIQSIPVIVLAIMLMYTVCGPYSLMREHYVALGLLLVTTVFYIFKPAIAQYAFLPLLFLGLIGVAAVTPKIQIWYMSIGRLDIIRIQPVFLLILLLFAAVNFDKLQRMRK